MGGWVQGPGVSLAAQEELIEGDKEAQWGKGGMAQWDSAVLRKGMGWGWGLTLLLDGVKCMFFLWK